MHGREDDLSNIAAQKLAAMDRDVAEVRQFLQQQDQNSKVLLDQFAFDIKKQVAGIESNFSNTMYSAIQYGIVCNAMQNTTLYESFGGIPTYMKCYIPAKGSGGNLLDYRSMIPFCRC